MIKAVIFDYGNVISSQQTSGVQEEMEKLTGVPASLFAGVYDTYRFEFDRGTINGAQMYAMLLKDAGYEALSKDTALMQKIAYIDMSSWRRINSDVVEWSLTLKKQGYKLGILSNIPHEFLDAYESEIPPFVEADYACFSCRVKLIKPEEAIYRDALRGLGIEAGEAVFFDDIQVNIDAANKLGIHGVLWTGLEDAKTRVAGDLRKITSNSEFEEKTTKKSPFSLLTAKANKENKGQNPPLAFFAIAVKPSYPSPSPFVVFPSPFRG